MKNTVPVLVGIMIGCYLTGVDVASTSALVAAIFGTTLAPVSGYYGPACWGDCRVCTHYTCEPRGCNAWWIKPFITMDSREDSLQQFSYQFLKFLKEFVKI